MARRWSIGVLLIVALSAGCPTGAVRPVTVGYRTASDLASLRVITNIPALHVAVVDAPTLMHRPPSGVTVLGNPVARARLSDPALTTAANGIATEWAYHATHTDLVPQPVIRAASAVTIAIVDTGADLTAPDIAAKAPTIHSVVADTPLPDTTGHGTFVASIAAGSVTNNEGIAGFGGDAKLLIVQSNRAVNTFTDVDEAAAIVWAVDQGAKIINLSLGGSQTSQTERDAILYATDHGVLLVAAAGNTGGSGNTPVYPAALLGAGGLAVGASNASGARASFSTAAPYVSLLAPGVRLVGDIPTTAPTAQFPRTTLAGSISGQYAYGSGTSYATPVISGIAALVWAANPALSAQQVVQVIESTASAGGTWSPATGYGIVDAANAVAKALGQSPPATAVSAFAPVKPSATVVATVNLRSWSTSASRRVSLDARR
jgi:subtilisin family serine protease